MLLLGALVILFIVYFLVGGYPSLSGKAVDEISLVTCEDSDGGDDPNVKGEVTETYLKDTSSREKGSAYFNDTCSYGNTLLERYCSLTNSATSKVYRCEKGCEDGACITDEVIVEEIDEEVEEGETGDEEPIEELPETEEKQPSIFARIINFFKSLFG